jgi:hypothetical protein
MRFSHMMTYDATILVCAFRYALGRRTYVVGCIVREIHRVWNSLSEGDRELIVREILEYRERFGNLGHECDERDWMSVVDRLKAEACV